MVARTLLLILVAIQGLLLLGPGQALASNNCFGSVYNDDSPNRTCTTMSPIPGDWTYSGPGHPWAYNHCAQGWNAANCIARGGTLSGSPCTSGSYCLNADDTTTEANMAGIADRLVNIWLAPCQYTTEDSGWGYSGTINGVTIGPDIKTPSEDLLVSSQKLFTHRLAGGPPTCAGTVYHVGAKNRPINVSCPKGTDIASYAAGGNYCLDETPGMCPVNNPVEIGLGSKRLTETDITSGSRSALVLRRSYNSHGVFNPTGIPLTGYTSSVPMGRGGQFGFRWRSNYDRRLFPVSPTISSPWWTLPSKHLASIQREDGTVQHFSRADGMESLPKPDATPARLTRLFATNVACPTDLTQACWEYRSGSNEIERYNGPGLLIEIAQGTSGVGSVRLSYDAQHHLTQVEDETGRTLTFAYVNSRVRLATTSDGETITYEYDDQDRLVEVHYPVTLGQPAPVRQYHYEDTRPGYQQFLTGVTGENGVRLSTIAYSDRGYVQSTVRAPNMPGGGVGAFQYTYSAPGTTPITTTYTDALGASTTVTHEYWRDLLRFKSQSQPCPTCGTTNVSSVTYHPTTQRLADSTDFRGIITRRETDTLGRVTSKVEVANTSCPAALPNCQASKRTTTTTWDSAYNAVTESRTLDPNNQIERVARTALNARGQVVAQCSIDPSVPAAMSYSCGGSASAPVGVRQTTREYCEPADVAAPGTTCPVLGLLKSVDGPRTDLSDVTSYTYYATTDETGCDTGGECHRKGDLWQVTNAVGHVTEIRRYDRAGRVSATIDPNGIRTDLEYTSRGRLSARKVRGADDGQERDDAITRIEYDPNGNVTRVIQPDESYTQYVHDEADRLIHVSDALGNRIVYTLDAAGNRTGEATHDASYNPGNPATSLRRQLSRDYDTLSRLVAIRDANNNATTFTYDANRNQDVVTDPLLIETDKDHDPLNRLIKTIGDKGTGRINATTKFEYDARDNLRKVTDPKSLDTTYTYDGLGNLVSLSSSDTGVTTYEYDQAGNRTSQTDARGIQQTYQYDAINRLIVASTPNTTTDYEYDVEDGCETPGFPIGRLGRMVDPSGATRYCHDRFGNLSAKGQANAGKREVVIGWSHDLAGNVSQINYNDQRWILLGRNPAGRILSVVSTTTEPGPPCPPNEVCGIVVEQLDRESLVSDVSYLPFGPTASITFGDGRIQARSYDQNYRIDGIDSSFADLDLDFTTNAAGDIVGISDGTSARNYTYDRLHRLTTVTDGASTVLEQFTYDATGNRLSKLEAGSTVPYAYPTNNHRLTEIAGVPRTYDAAGNLTLIDSTGPSYTYDERNRLSEATTAAGHAQYLYNGRGERVSKEANVGGNGVNSTYVFDQAGHLIAEIDGSGVMRGYVWMDDMLVAVFDDSATNYIESDHLNSPRAVVVPRYGTTVWSWPLLGSAFGENAANEDVDGDSAPFVFNPRFPGQYFDAERELHYNYFRDYEPSTSRYLESDPVGLRAGMSTYQYAGASPLMLSDWSGLITCNPGRTYNRSTGECEWNAGPNPFRPMCMPDESCESRCDDIEARCRTMSEQGDAITILGAVVATRAPQCGVAIMATGSFVEVNEDAWKRKCEQEAKDCREQTCAPICKIGVQDPTKAKQ